MWKLVSVICLLNSVNGLPTDIRKPLTYINYHESVGIPRAARIKAAEEAIDFNGSRILGGSQSGLGQFPHFGGLIISFNATTIRPLRHSVCGSSLISNNKLVTAAHCWFDGGLQGFQIEVVLGSTTLYSGGMRFVTTDIVLHPDYNSWVKENNIAVVTIPWVGYTNYIRNIALASGSQSYVGWWAQTAGFGELSYGIGIPQTQSLRHITAQVISNDDCKIRYGDTYVFDSTICIEGSAYRSTCDGDSGGPLQVAGPTLIGINSFFYACGWSWPVGFNRVSHFEPWIRTQMF